MKVHATLKNLRIAPRKVRLVTHSVIGMDASEALLQLSKQVKKSSQPIYDLLKSAVANATNNFGLEKTNLSILEIRVGDGLRLKRWMPRAFGRATPLLRRGSNVTIVIEEKIEGKNQVAKKGMPETVSTETAALPAGETKVRKSGKRAGTQDMTKGNVSNKTAVKVVKKVFQRKSV